MLAATVLEAAQCGCSGLSEEPDESRIVALYRVKGGKGQHWHDADVLDGERFARWLGAAIAAGDALVTLTMIEAARIA